MVFSSMVFLWIFLPAILAAYFICPGKGRNLLLVLFSLVFYAWGEPVYILLMLFSVIINFVSGICLERFPDRKKIILAVCILANLSLLGYFKYFNFSCPLRFFLLFFTGIIYKSLWTRPKGQSQPQTALPKIVPTKNRKPNT